MLRTGPRYLETMENFIKVTGVTHPPHNMEAEVVEIGSQ